MAKGNANRLVRFSVSIPQELAEAFDGRLEEAGYPNRSEAVRDMMRDYLIANASTDDDAPMMGTVTIVYDHHRADLSKRLTEVQHSCGEAIVCTTHVHLDMHNCLEVIIVRGSSKQVRHIADQLISTKGVTHGRLVCTVAEPHHH